jgi:hypothetical protein
MSEVLIPMGNVAFAMDDHISLGLELGEPRGGKATSASEVRSNEKAKQTQRVRKEREVDKGKEGALRGQTRISATPNREARGSERKTGRNAKVQGSARLQTMGRLEMIRI